MLTEAAVSGKIDNLLGLKENVIIGHLIPAGYRDLRSTGRSRVVYDEEEAGDGAAVGDPGTITDTRVADNWKESP